MATTKASSKKPSSRATAAAKKTTTTKKPVAAKSTAAAKTTKAVTTAELKVSKKRALFPVTLPNIILSELIGTFILTIVAFTAFAVSPYMASQAKVLSNWLIDPFFIGLTLTVLVMGLGSISGAHVNPAVTFGLWSMRKLKTIMVPVYWGSQFLGALLAVGVVNVMTKGEFIVGFANFAQFNLPLLFIEIIGTAIFMFGIASVISREGLSTSSKAVGIGMSLAIALVAGVGMLAPVQKAGVERYKAQVEGMASQEEASKVKLDRPILVNGAVLNPAVALAVSENGSDQQSSSETTTATTTPSSRFGLEVIVGSLVGAALGGNLFLLVSYRLKNEA